MTSRQTLARLLLISNLVVLGACAQGSASTMIPSLSPTPSTAASVVASPAASASSAAEDVPQLPVQVCCSELALEMGRYGLPGWLGPVLTIDVGDGLGLVNDASARYLVLGTGESSVGTMTSLVTLLATPSGTTTEDVVASLRDTTTLAFDGEPRTAAVGALQATVMDATAKRNPERSDDPAADIPGGTVDLDPLEAFVEPGFSLTTSSPEARLRFVVLDVDGRVLIAWLEAPAAEADAFFTQAAAMLATLQPR